MLLIGSGIIGLVLLLTADNEVDSPVRRLLHSVSRSFFETST